MLENKLPDSYGGSSDWLQGSLEKIDGLFGAEFCGAAQILFLEEPVEGRNAGKAASHCYIRDG